MDVAKGEGAVAFGGLASGLDTESIVGAMVESARSPIRQIERQKEKLDAHQTHYERAMVLAQALDNTTHALATTSRFVSYTASSTDPNVVEVSAGSGSHPGHVTVEVEHLARGYRGSSDAVQSDSVGGLLGKGTLGWSVGEKKYSIDVEETTSLRKMAQLITDKASGVVALPLFDGKAWSLRLTGAHEGSANRVSFSTDPTGLGLDRPEHIIRQAEDAGIILDGKTSVTRTSNLLNDVIPGVTLNLQSTGGPVEIYITADREKMMKGVQDFVSSYNELTIAISEMTRSGKKTNDRTLLTGDTTLRNLQRGMQDAVSRPVHGLSGEIQSLQSIGLSSQKDGTIKLNEVKLERALASHHQQVAQLFGRDFVNDTSGIAHTLQTTLKAYTSTTGGHLSHKGTSIDRQKGQLDRRTNQLESHIERYEAGLRQKFTDLEQRMSKLKSQNSFLSAQLDANQNKNK